MYNMLHSACGMRGLNQRSEVPLQRTMSSIFLAFSFFQSSIVEYSCIVQGKEGILYTCMIRCKLWKEHHILIMPPLTTSSATIAFNAHNHPNLRAWTLNYEVKKPRIRVNKIQLEIIRCLTTIYTTFGGQNPIFLYNRVIHKVFQRGMKPQV